MTPKPSPNLDLAFAARWLVLMVLVPIGGCSGTSALDRDDEATAAAEAAVVPMASTSDHDLGTALTGLQTTFRHEFVLENPTDQLVRIVRGIAFTPCCSDIGPLPEAIPPGESVAVPVEFRPGNQGGRRRVQFAVATDSPEMPSRLFSLHATLVSEVDVERLPDSDQTLPLDQGGKQVFRVTCRRKGDRGRDAPTAVLAADPVPASFAGPIRREADGDIQVASRDVEVTLPASDDAGIRRGEVQLRWEGGETQSQGVNWRVVPRIEAAPPGLTLHPEDGRVKRSFRLGATDRPFRILAIEGADPVGTGAPPSEAAKTHLLTLEFDPEAMGTGAARDVTIRTDHPRQTTVTLSVLVLGDRKEAPR